MVYTFRNLETGGPHFDTPGYCKMVDAWAQELIQSVYISFPYEKCLAMGMSIEARSQTVCRPCLTQITTDNEEVRKVMAGHSAEDLPFMQDEDVVKVFAQLPEGAFRQRALRDMVGHINAEHDQDPLLYLHVKQTASYLRNSRRSAAANKFAISTPFLVPFNKLHHKTFTCFRKVDVYMHTVILEDATTLYRYDVSGVLAGADEAKADPHFGRSLAAPRVAKYACRDLTSDDGRCDFTVECRLMTDHPGQAYRALVSSKVHTCTQSDRSRKYVIKSTAFGSDGCGERFLLSDIRTKVTETSSDDESDSLEEKTSRKASDSEEEDEGEEREEDYGNPDENDEDGDYTDSSEDEMPLSIRKKGKGRARSREDAIPPPETRKGKGRAQRSPDGADSPPPYDTSMERVSHPLDTVENVYDSPVQIRPPVSTIIRPKPGPMDRLKQHSRIRDSETPDTLYWAGSSERTTGRKVQPSAVTKKRSTGSVSSAKSQGAKSSLSRVGSGIARDGRVISNPPRTGDSRGTRPGPSRLRSNRDDSLEAYPVASGSSKRAHSGTEEEERAPKRTAASRHSVDIARDDSARPRHVPRSPESERGESPRPRSPSRSPEIERGESPRRLQSSSARHRSADAGHHPRASYRPATPSSSRHASHSEARAASARASTSAQVARSRSPAGRPAEQHEARRPGQNTPAIRLRDLGFSARAVEFFRFNGVTTYEKLREDFEEAEIEHLLLKVELLLGEMTTPLTERTAEAQYNVMRSMINIRRMQAHRM